MENWTTVEVLRHARHDWLNKLQLINGYASLNNMEKVKDIVEDIILEAQQESKLSNLHLPKFAELLLTYNWEGHPFRLEYEILDADKRLLPEDGRLYGWMKSFLACVEEMADPYGDNLLSLTFGTPQSAARFFFEFSGTIKTPGLLTGWLEAECRGRHVVHAQSETVFSVEVVFPEVPAGGKLLS
ncbi:sporulation protein [Weizmannia acidilactici]|uniref:Sporulation protein n=1 Tax=Weizmannia acidilactici TaxID=2607726 RepID=A0A5J4JBN2_9BACI|nr:Spo0B C-terminal domain-containing protein [Weizmannia acidilactici]GER66202.1 sporulation protein [Weizmannia acidilactici]GER69161.1 sporulation protein [Weizmannia acidilactici]GER72142.1 sporulation protein [Weizmannia acidilactici]